MRSIYRCVQFGRGLFDDFTDIQPKWSNYDQSVAKTPYTYRTASKMGGKLKLRLLAQLRHPQQSKFRRKRVWFDKGIGLFNLTSPSLNYMQMLEFR